MHFGAMYSQKASHRDKPMRNVAFLRAMMQKVEVDTAEREWGRSPPAPAGSAQ